jgi:hypothetical protein
MSLLLSLLLTVVPFVTTQWSGRAAALSGHHLVAPIVKDARVPEGLAKVAFSCSSTTGAATLKLTNVQVIDESAASTWPTYGMFYSVGTHSGTTTLTQNSTNGLFGVTAKFTIDPSQCASGVVFHANSLVGSVFFPGQPLLRFTALLG